MKNNEKKQNQMYHDEVQGVIEIPLKKLHCNIDFIQDADVDVTNIILTSKGKWVYTLMSELQYAILIGVPDLYETIDKDPRIDMLPQHIRAVPIHMVISAMLSSVSEMIEMSREYMDTVTLLAEYGGDKI